MTKNLEPPYPPVARRRTATAEDLEARRTGDYPPASPHRVGHTPGLHGEDAPYLSEEIIRPGQRTMRGNGYMNGVAPTPQRPSIEEDEEETHAYAEYPKRGRTTQRVYPAAHPTHFIAINLNGQILVVEIPGGNASKAKVYIAPTLFGSGQDLVPVKLSFEDCDGNGSPDLNIHIQGSDKIICFPNNGKTFDAQSTQH